MFLSKYRHSKKFLFRLLKTKSINFKHNNTFARDRKDPFTKRKQYIWQIHVVRYRHRVRYKGMVELHNQSRRKVIKDKRSLPYSFFFGTSLLIPIAVLCFFVFVKIFILSVERPKGSVTEKKAWRSWKKYVRRVRRLVFTTYINGSNVLNEKEMNRRVYPVFGRISPKRLRGAFSKFGSVVEYAYNGEIAEYSYLWYESYLTIPNLNDDGISTESVDHIIFSANNCDYLGFEIIYLYKKQTNIGIQPSRFILNDFYTTNELCIGNHFVTPLKTPVPNLFNCGVFEINSIFIDLWFCLLLICQQRIN